MENDLSNQNKRFYSDDYQELVNKLKCGSDLTEVELRKIMWDILFRSFDDSIEAEKEDKNNSPMRVMFLTLVGNIGGRSTKFLPYALRYRKRAFEVRKMNYDEIVNGYNIAYINACRENVEALVKQLDIASLYSSNYQKLSDEIEDNISKGLDSFRGFVGIDTMLEMDKERAKILSLRKDYKKM